MLRLLLPFLACFLFATSALSQTCTDIRTFDFGNATIHTGTKDENHINATAFNGAFGDGETFHIVDGKGFRSDDPDNPQSHDWGITITSNHLVHPDPLTWARVLEVERDHLTGTGTIDFVLVFTCSHGRVTRIFQFSDEGVRLERFDNHDLVLDQTIWAPDDDHASPSLHRELFYRWDAKLHRYRLVRKTKISR
jgi:hypothetical protein